MMTDDPWVSASLAQVWESEASLLTIFSKLVTHTAGHVATPPLNSRLTASKDATLAETGAVNQSDQRWQPNHTDRCTHHINMSQ